MSDRKAVIKNADMSEEMQQDAVDCATQALEKYNIEKVSVTSGWVEKLDVLFVLILIGNLCWELRKKKYCKAHQSRHWEKLETNSKGYSDSDGKKS